jgi:hypothetical protein
MGKTNIHKATPLEQALADYRILFDVLAKDLSTIIGKSKRIMPQSKRRLFIRSLLSLVEADTWKRKQICVHLFRLGRLQLTEHELALLNDEQCDLDKQGNVTVRRKQLRSADNYRFAINIFVRATGIEYKFPVQHAGWQSLLETIAFRNRITHPKSVKEIHITDKELRTVFRAFEFILMNSRDIRDLLSHTAMAAYHTN